MYVLLAGHEPPIPETALLMQGIMTLSSNFFIFSWLFGLPYDAAFATVYFEAGHLIAAVCFEARFDWRILQ